MALRRHFLGWDQPLTRSVRERLVPAPPRVPLDLEGTLLVTPTRQAGRRLVDALARYCGEHGSALLSCRTLTPPALLLPDPPPPDLASETDVQWAWSDVLRQADPQNLPGLFPSPPPSTGMDWAIAFASAVNRVRQALVDAGLTFGTLVSRYGSDLPEQERWRDLARLEATYRERLDSVSRRDPSDARIAHAKAPQLPEGTIRVVVAAVPDLTPLCAQLLDRLAEQIEIELLIAAPESEADTFDAYGRPDPAHWCTCTLDIPDPSQTIDLAADPRDQGARTVQFLQSISEEVAIGVPDRDVIPYLAGALAEHDVASFDPADVPLTTLPLYGLIAHVTAVVGQETYAAVAQLLRHPDWLSYLVHDHSLRVSDLLKELDTFQNRRLPLDRESMLDWLRGADADTYPTLSAALAALEHMLPRSGDALAPALRELLQTVYRHHHLKVGVPHDDAFARGARQVDDALRELEQREAESRLSPPQAARLLMQRLDTTALHHDRPPEAIDLDGWLELPWNDAPQLVITGMNENAVPGGRVDDPFLPDALRARLDVRSERTRLARDSFLFRLILASRTPGAVKLITGKTSDSGDPLRPSRLLLRCPDDELPERAMALFRHVPDIRSVPPASVSFTLDPCATPPDERPLPSMIHVTSFRDYLTCPFRFYLGRILGMESLDDSKRVPDALDFGIMVHHALQRMADDATMRECTDTTRLAGFLQDEAEQWTRGRFGDNPVLPVTLALDAACQRLDAAARLQVELLEAGWEILEAERGFEVTLGSMVLRGKIDRVDRHRESGAIRVIDYKTKDTPESPAKAHLAPARDDTPAFAEVTHLEKATRWIDLQLPLYVIYGGHPKATPAYFNLPRAISDTRLECWDTFDADLAASARTCAESIVARIQDGVFWPPTEHVTYDNFEQLFRGGTPASFTELS